MIQTDLTIDFEFNPTSTVGSMFRINPEAKSNYPIFNILREF